jgi:hypothetical protein
MDTSDQVVPVEEQIVVDTHFAAARDLERKLSSM